ncbi:MAG TPA: NAD(P)H-dependent oxidoreductase [Nannocystaceae bacterium]|nr:NAD(P)H-dependent oxidoreductase [Nannocystaceae bacterium]
MHVEATPQLHLAPEVVAIAGTKSASSTTTRLLAWVAGRLAHEGRTVTTVSVSKIPHDVLFDGDTSHPSFVAAARSIASARAVVVATPVRLASYCGALKLFLDALPADALRGKIVLPIATGAATQSHVPLDTALVPELALLGARYVFSTVFVADEDVRGEDERGAMLQIVPRGRVERALTALQAGLRARGGRN